MTKSCLVQLAFGADSMWKSEEHLDLLRQFDRNVSAEVHPFKRCVVVRSAVEELAFDDGWYMPINAWPLYHVTYRAFVFYCTSCNFALPTRVMLCEGNAVFYAVRGSEWNVSLHKMEHNFLGSTFTTVEVLSW